MSGDEYLVLSSHALFGNLLLQEHMRCVSPENPAQADFSFSGQNLWESVCQGGYVHVVIVNSVGSVPEYCRSDSSSVPEF